MHTVIRNTLLIRNKIDTSRYSVLREYIGGLALKPLEVKSIHKGACSLSSSYCRVCERTLEIVMQNIKIHSVDTRYITVLLNKKEIININIMIKSGYVLVPTELFKVNNLIKIRLILAKHLRKHDKRELYRKQDKSARKEIRKYTDGIIKV